MRMRRISRVTRVALLFISFIIIQTSLIYFVLIRQIKPKQDNKVTNTCVNKTLVKGMFTPNTSVHCTQTLKVKGAFVFYITNSMPAYECYIYVLLHQLQFVYPCYSNVDYVILYESGYKFQKAINKFNNIKLREVQSRNLNHSTQDWYYAKCYLKLEVFSLYTDYERIVFVDADGIFMKDPSPLFHIVLFPRPIGAAYSYWFYPEKWLTSSIFIADLDVDIYTEILGIYKKDLRSLFVGRKILDMEIFNWLFKENRTEIIEDLVYIDSHYIDEEYIKRFYEPSQIPHYVHFSHLKPHLNHRVSSCLDESRLPEAKPEFFKVHRTFWEYYYLYC